MIFLRLNKNNPLHFFTLLLAHCAICILISSCANKVAPSGGEKDIIPPKLVTSTPENFSTRFNQQQIKIEFDEYIQLTELNKQLIISPLIDPAPEITVSKKTLVIRFDSLLKENTTYTFNFGSAVADIHEKNVYDNFQFVFSTGDYVDSLSLSGHVENADNLQPGKGVYVMLYKNPDDSLPYKKLPDYFAKTNEGGDFKINNIAAGSFKIFALSDKNSNYLFDQPDESIAFLAAPVVVGDTSKINLRLFKNLIEKIRLKNSGVGETGKLNIIFNTRAENVTYKTIGMEKNPWLSEQYSLNRDTVILWTADTTLDSLQIVLLQNGKVFDTANFVLKRKFTGKGGRSRALSFLSNASAGTLEPGKTLALEFSQPLVFIDESKIVFKKDSVITQGLRFEFTDSLKRTVHVNYEWKENEHYDLLFLPGAFQSMLHLKNDSLTLSFKLIPAVEFGNVQLKIKPGAESPQYLVQLVNEKDEVIREQIITTATAIDFNLLQPATYRIRMVYDENKNNRWDTGNYLRHLQPEKIIYYKENITVRANWDLELEWIVE